MANLACSYEDTAYVFMLATAFFFLKKKKALKLLQHRSILPILIGQVSELFIGANEFNIKSS